MFFVVLNLRIVSIKSLNCRLDVGSREGYTRVGSHPRHHGGRSSGLLLLAPLFGHAGDHEGAGGVVRRGREGGGV